MKSPAGRPGLTPSRPQVQSVGMPSRLRQPAGVGVMMRSLLALVMVCMATAVAAPAGAADGVGLRQLAVMAPERGQALDIALWYPAAAGGTPVRFGESGIFEGVPAGLDAPLVEGPFPLVLVSHGGMRAAPNVTGWIAARLVGEGFAVAVVQPPALGERGAEAAVPEIWLRPADLGATLTALAEDPALAGHMALDRVGALGFFLGGTSALALVGGRLDEASYRGSCDAGGTGLDCAWFEQGGIDLHAIELAPLARSNLDERIAVAVAVDPELGGSFEAASLARIEAPVLVINLGRPDTIRPGLQASDVAAAIPTARYATVPDATPFSSFSVCKPKAVAILLEEGEDDIICRDGDGRTRAAIHAELARLIADAFRPYLQPAP